jgi:hypothetical protein
MLNATNLFSPPVRVDSLRAEAYSADDKFVVITLTTKYSTAKRTYSVPLKCFDDLVLDLQRLKLLDVEPSEEQLRA